MHIHEYGERLLLGDRRVSTDIAIFQCADRDRCGAVRLDAARYAIEAVQEREPVSRAGVAGPTPPPR